MLHTVLAHGVLHTVLAHGKRSLAHCTSVVCLRLNVIN